MRLVVGLTVVKPRRETLYLELRQNQQPIDRLDGS